MTIGVLEVQNIICLTMANCAKIVLDSFDLFDKLIVYAKNKVSNLNTFSSALKFVVPPFNYLPHL
jgi:hypothetical protein